MEHTPLEHLQGKYEILEKIREGGMGAIYKVRHRLLEEVRVIKLIRPQFQEDVDIRARFEREAKTAIKLRHPNIAQLYDYSVDADGTAFIVMEYIEGRTFADILQTLGPPPLPLALEMAHQALEAIGYLHKRGIVHRDIAPDNLMLCTGEDGRPCVKLIDLGVAKAMGSGISLTMAGTFLGKLRYASPEQFRSGDGGKVDQRSDLYSFGVVFYQLLTGQLPLRGTSLSTLMAAHLLEPPRGFSETDPDGRVPDEVRAAVLRALAKEQKDRFQDAEAFVAALDVAQGRYPLSREAFEAALAALGRPAAPEPVRSSGDTQGLLDRQFAAETATPAPEPTAATARMPNAGNIAIAEIRVLLELGRERDAQKRLDAVLAQEPDNAEAIRLRRELERRERTGAGVPAVAERKPRAEPVPVETVVPAAAKTTEPATREAVAVATSEAAAPVSSAPQPALPSEPAVAAPEAEAAPQPAAQPDEPAADLPSTEAAAAPALADVPRAEPEPPHVDTSPAPPVAAARPPASAAAPRGPLAELDRIGKAPGAVVQVPKSLSATVRTVREKIEAGALAEAEELISASQAVFGERDELRALERRLEQSRAERRARVEIGSLCDQALELASSGRLPDAFKLIDRARAVRPMPDDLRTVLATAETLLKQQVSAYQRRRELDEALERIASLLETGDFDEAHRATELARKLFPDEVALQAVQGAFGGEHAAIVARCIARAHELTGQGGFEAASALLQQGASLDGANPDLLTLLEDTRVRAVTVAVDEFLGRGDVGGAERVLAEAQRAFPNSQAFASLRRRVAHAGS